jgi:hypothetical protein
MSVFFFPTLNLGRPDIGYKKMSNYPAGRISGASLTLTRRFSKVSLSKMHLFWNLWANKKFSNRTYFVSLPNVSFANLSTNFF